MFTGQNKDALVDDKVVIMRTWEEECKLTIGLKSLKM